MSGGVDSSVAAALLKDRGCEVVGCFMRLGSPGETLDEPMPYDSAAAGCDPAKVKIGKQGCCSVGDAHDAHAVAAELGIPLYVCNFKKDFGRIIDYFVDEYARGRTPNPCVRCNDWLKFGKLHGYAAQIGAAFVASGHYARIDRTGEAPRLMRGRDPHKDQSYVLFGAPRERLASMALPIGGCETKDEVRAIAERYGLPVFDKPDSQEICFVPDNDYAGLVERRRPDLAREGAILDREGREVGTHEGQHKFTIGQRRGVGVALGHPIYVIDKDPGTNTVTIGEREDLASSSCVATERNLLCDAALFDGGRRVMARHRYNMAPVPATVSLIDDPDELDRLGGPGVSGRTGALSCAFDEPQRAVTAGQALVVYDAGDPDWVLGGGWVVPAST